MAGLLEVIGLLHRADWTRLSLSAEVRFEQDGDLARRRENALRTESMRRMGVRPGSPGMPGVAAARPDAERDVSDHIGGAAALLIAPGLTSWPKWTACSMAPSPQKIINQFIPASLRSRGGPRSTTGDHGDRADGSDGEQALDTRPPDAAPRPAADCRERPRAAAEFRP